MLCRGGASCADKSIQKQNYLDAFTEAVLLRDAALLNDPELMGLVTHWLSFWLDSDSLDLPTFFRSCLNQLCCGNTSWNVGLNVAFREPREAGLCSEGEAVVCCTFQPLSIAAEKWFKDNKL